VLVDVVRLRFNGRKLAKSVVLEIPTMRGELVVTRQLMRRGQVWQTVARLHGTHRIESMIPELTDVRLIRMQGGNIVICGVEEIYQRKESFFYRQAWWCRVTPVSSQSSEPPDRA
jgi:hypothetical protein